MANLQVSCPRHTGLGLVNARVASGQREPRIIIIEHVVLLALKCGGVEPLI